METVVAVIYRLNQKKIPRLQVQSQLKSTGTTAQRPNTEIGERYNTDTHPIEGYFGDTSSWRNIGTGGPGTLTNANNVGTGSGVFKQILIRIDFRSLVQSGGISITQNTDDLTITDTITSSNVGGGTELFKQRATNNFSQNTYQYG